MVQAQTFSSANMFTLGMDRPLCLKHKMLQLQESIGKDIAKFNPICKHRLWMDVYVRWLVENKNEALNLADGIECFCHEDDASNVPTLRLGASWVSATANDVGNLADLEPMWIDLENEEQGEFIPGDDSSEPEWIEDEESNYYQRWMSQGEE